MIIMTKHKPVIADEHIATEKEKEYYNKLFDKEKEKVKRDKLCGGMNGSQYIRLHDRNDY